MKINLTIVASLILAISIVTAGFTFFQTIAEKNKMRLDLMMRSSYVSADYYIARQQYISDHDSLKFRHAVQLLNRRYRLVGLASYATMDSLSFSSPTIRDYLHQAKENIQFAFSTDTLTGKFISFADHYLFQYIGPIKENKFNNEVVIIYFDAAYVKQSIWNLWLRSIIRGSLQAFLVAVITFLMLHWGIFTPLKQMVTWMKSARVGRIELPSKRFPFRFLIPLQSEATRLAEAISEARAAAEEEVILRTNGEAIWTPARLKAEAKLILKNRILIVVSNREPYMHIHDGRIIRCIIPASGMVTAMEPILNACGGLWVATGSGDADRVVVDSSDKIKVPPEDPKYALRRVWISQEEEEHFYYGFSNEGLWPLCHVAHTRPVFRMDDWNFYLKVNQKFSDIILEEIKAESEPFILVQDYHFALVPTMIKKSRPDARVSLFWHIPWPNPESFGICPWQEEILLGMLGADLIGFHTQYHCNNFLSTVNRTLEARVAWETFTVTIGDHTTQVSPFPISISFTMKDYNQINQESVQVNEVLKSHRLQAKFLGVGVDRIDYTKGILERFHAIERFLEKYSSYQGQFTFVQIGAPSRTFIKNYSTLVENVEKEAERINRKFQNQVWKPILLLSRHHSHQEIAPYYKAASLCMVTSLHDGMNLVAKEFVASRNNQTGVLVLSRFTGAAQELSGALIVNPYHIEEMADAIKIAIEMPEIEQRSRMTQMRQTILRHNIYSWAADLLKGMELL